VVEHYHPFDITSTARVFKYNFKIFNLSCFR